VSAGPLVPARLSAHARSAGRDDNPRYVEAWRFRNRANTDPNEGDVNAPQHEREFAFVVTPEAYRAAATALDALLWGQHSHVERAQERAALETASRGRGTLRITGSTRAEAAIAGWSRSAHLTRSPRAAGAV
jgi:hypothetical protein